MNNNVAPIVTVSYGLCEASMGSSYVAYMNSLWQQAAAQGQSVFVSSGDTGAAGCSSQADTSATVLGVNGLCSSPYSTCVGGTEFVDGSNPGQFWLPGNDTSDGSATGYIPETVWNESGSNGGSGVIAGGGGASIIFSKPLWQNGLGVPADGKRDVPDVSLSAAQHDGYAMYQSQAGGLFFVGGTSLSTPSFAGLMALVNQKAGGPQGLANPVLYNLAAKQAGSGAAVFHDITTGNNTVPGITGFSAGLGYDLASGLGSVDANQLVNHWSDGIAGISLIASSLNLKVNAGQSTQLTLTSISGVNAAVAFAVSGAPAGVTATFAPASIASPGSGEVVLNLATTVAAKPGSYTITISASGGGQTATSSIPLTIGAPTFVLAASSSTLNLGVGASSKITVTTTAQTGFSAALALTIAGAPTGMTATLSTRAVAAPGSGSLSLSLANVSAAPGTYSLIITATGGGQTQTRTVTVLVPTFTVTSPAGWYKGNSGGTVTIPVTVTPQAGFNSAITLSLTPSYLPSGITGVFAPASAPGSTTTVSTLTLTIAKSIPNGAYPFMITGTGSGITISDYVWLLVGIQGSCTLAVYDTNHQTNNLTVTAGNTVTGLEVCLWPQGSITDALNVTFSGVPAGVTIQIPNPLMGDGNFVPFTINVPQSMAAGTYPMYIHASSTGGYSGQYYFTIVVTANSFALTTPQTALSITQGTSSTLSATTAHKGVFNSAINLAWSGLPAGVTAALAKSAVAAPGDGTVVTTFSASASATPGTYTATLSATGGGMTQSVPVALTIAPPSCTLAVTYPASSKALSLFAGQTASVPVSCSGTKGTFSAPLTLSVSGVPQDSGITGQTGSSSMAAGGTSSVGVTTPISLAATNFTLTLTATSGAFTTSVPVAVAVSASNFTLTAPSTLSVVDAATAQLSLTSTHHGAFNSAVSLAWSGLPAGVTATLAKSSLAAPGDGSVVTTFAATATASPGTYSITLTATGGGVTQTVAVTLTVAPQPSCTMGVTYPAATTSPMTVVAGQTGNVSVSCTAVQGTFTSPLALSLSGMPTGVTAKSAASTMTAGGSVLIQVTTTQSLGSGSVSFNLTATSGTFSQTIQIPLVVKANSFTVNATENTTTLKIGSSGQYTAALTSLGAFNSPVTFTWSGLPAGVTASLSPSTLAAPGNGSAVTTFKAASTAKAGTYTVTLKSSGGGYTQSSPLALTITTP